MFKAIANYLLRMPTPAPAAASATVATQDCANVKAAPSPTPVYPPVDTGIPTSNLESILNSQEVLLLRLRRLAGGKDDHYEKYYFQVICNLIDYIQLLPASQKSHHNGAGGLLRLCLEVGFYSLQSSERVVFASHAGVESRRELEPRWRYATFIAALCSELYRVISEMVVTDVDGNVWPKYLKSLTQWAQENRLDRYYLSWHRAHSVQTAVAGRSDVAIIMKSILPDYTLQYLEDVNSEILPIVFAVASGSSHPTDNPIAKIVLDTKDKIVKRDEATRQERYGQLTVGNHLEPYLVDAMRILIAEKIWLVNLPKSRLWYAKEGLFLIWKNGAKEILAQISNAGIAGVPRDINTLASMLCESRICLRNNQELYWMVKPEDADDYYQCMKIADPRSLLEDVAIPFAEIALLGAEPTKATKTIARKVESEVQVEPSEAALQMKNAETVNNQSAALPKKTDEVPEKKTSIRTPIKQKPKATPDMQGDLLSGLVESTSTDATLLDEKRVEHMIGEVAYSESEGGQIEIDSTPSFPFMDDDSLLGSESPPNTSTQVPHQVETKSQENTGQVVKSTSKVVQQDDDDSAEIAPVVAKMDSYADLLSERGKKILKPEMAEVIGKMIDDFQKGGSKDLIFTTATNGIAFELVQLQRYGVGTDKIIGLLHNNSWIETPPENPEKKLVKVTNPKGKQVNCVVIKFASAQLLGFVSDDS